MPEKIKIARRKFLGLLGAVASLGLLYSLKSYFEDLFGSSEHSIALSSQTSKPTKRLSILQGATSSDTTQISICLPTQSNVTVYATNSTGKKLTPTSRVDRSDPNATHKFITCIFNGLALGETYQLVVESTAGQILDSRHFSTLDTNKTTFRAALISCMHDANVDVQEVMWKTVEANKPNVMFFLGDSVYVDAFHKTPGRSHVDAPFFWTRYIDVRTTLYLYQMQKLIPVFATWDDHDTGTNDGNYQAPFLPLATQMFDTAFPRHPIENVLARTYGVGTHLKIFNIDIMMMDGRSFRSPKGAPGEQTHWGTQQEEYLKGVLATSTRPVWIMNGTQFFGGYRLKGEAYQKVHPKSFKKFLEVLANSKAPALLTSGDIHYSEVQQVDEVVGYPLFEITSSSLHTRSKSWLAAGFNRHRWAANTKMNFVSVDVKVNGNSMQVVARSIKADSDIAFKKSFVVSKEDVA